jgi:hypothetical protein
MDTSETAIENIEFVLNVASSSLENDELRLAMKVSFPLASHM